MTPRERYLATLTYQQPDRVPFAPGHGRESTQRNWQQQGLPADHRQYGRQMAYRGGVDKRAIAKGGAVIRAEIDRLRPVIAAGGYIPTCDHGVPADVTWPNFVAYSRLLAEATGWL